MSSYFKDGEKILRIDRLYFKLPDSFDMQLPDALRLLASYLEPDVESPVDRKDVPEKTAWERFCGTVYAGGRVYAQDTTVQRYSAEENRFRKYRSQLDL